MDKKVFDAQIARLIETYSDRAYPPPRVAMLWRQFSTTWEATFVEAIDFLVSNSRNAPLAKEIGEAILEAQDRERALRNTSFKLPPGTDTIANAVANTKADKEFVEACLSLLARKNTLSKEQWEQGLTWLEDTAHRISPKPVCRLCQNSGYAFEIDDKGYSQVGVCHCRHGNERPKKLTFKNSYGETVTIEIKTIKPKELA